MRWKNDSIEDGAIRRKRVFLLLPALCTDGYWYWLERVSREQQYNRLYLNWNTTRYVSLRDE
jgi:hypothetical protein